MSPTSSTDDLEARLLALQAENARLHAELHSMKAAAEVSAAAWAPDFGELAADDQQAQRRLAVMAAIDNLPCPVGYWSRDLYCRYANSAYHRWFGRDNGSMIDQHLCSITSPERITYVLDSVEQCLRESKTVIIEGHIDSPVGDGSNVQMLILVPHIVDGEPVGAYAQLLHSPQLSHAMAHLQENEERLRAVFDVLPVGLALTDPDGHIIDCNKASEALLGITKAEHLARDYDSKQWIIRRQDGSIMPVEEYASVRALRERRQITDVTMYVETHSGGIWLSVSAQPINHPNYGVVVAYYDVSERQRYAQALRSSESRLERVLRGSNDGWWEFDAHSGDLVYSMRGWGMLGYAEHEIPQGGVANPALFWPGEYERVAHFVNQAARNGTEHYEIEFQLQHRDGHKVPVLSRGTLTRHPETGEVIFMSGTNTDLTERKRFEAELVAAKDAAEAASRAKSRFLATMSHEIRTPLNGVLGVAQLLQEPRMEDAERQGLARVVLNSGQTLLTLLNDVLDLSKIEAGKFTLQPSRMSPARLLDDLQTLFGETARGKGLDLQVSWRGTTGQEYWFDANRLRQMLSNLISNAIKFTPKGSVTVTGHAASHGPADLLRFTVQDTGPGIAEGAGSKLFQPFSQLDASDTRAYGGTGLGLSIVKQLAGMMGGSVGVDSVPGEGATFWFTVVASATPPGTTGREEHEHPAGAAPALMAMPAQRRQTPPAASDSQQRSPHILVVEDNPTNRMVVETLLRKRGVAVVHARQGAEAVAMITGGLRPDAVLMDCQMPVMDGLEASRRIRAWEQATGLPPVPILALTAGAFDEDRNNCLRAGMNEFVTKPISIDLLLEALSRWVPMDSIRQPQPPVGFSRSGKVPSDA